MRSVIATAVAAGVLASAPNAFAGGLLGGSGAADNVAGFITATQSATQPLTPTASSTVASASAVVASVTAPVVQPVMQSTSTLAEAAQAVTQVVETKAPAISGFEQAARGTLTQVRPLARNTVAGSTVANARTSPPVPVESTPTHAAPSASAMPTRDTSSVSGASPAVSKTMPAISSVPAHRAAPHVVRVVKRRAFSASTPALPRIGALWTHPAAHSAPTSVVPPRLAPQLPTGSLFGAAMSKALGIAAAAAPNTFLFLIFVTSLLLAVLLRAGLVRVSDTAPWRTAQVSPLERPG
jgi:hypothetical protein